MITSTDPISDMLTRIRNGRLVGKSEVNMPHSNTKEAVAKILVSQGFLSGLKASKVDGHKNLSITLCGIGENPKVTHLARISKPGRRVYAQAGEIPTVKRGRGIVVISTSKGMMSGSEAKSKGLGGELICEVY